MSSNASDSQADDQRTSNGQTEDPPRFEAGQKNSHDILDSKDQRSLGNTLAAAVKAENEEEKDATTIEDPLAPARSHGNEPSRGAVIDAEILADEKEYLENKEEKE